MTAASPPRRESLGELIRATIIAILIVLSTVPITFAYAMIVDPEETVGGLLWDQFRLNDLADEATRDFPEFFGPAAEQGLAAEADEGGYVYLYLLDEARLMAGEVCDAFYQAMLGKDPTLMSGFMVFTDGTPQEEVHCGSAWWTWWWGDLE